MKIALFGYGKMGALCEAVAQARGYTIVAILRSSGLQGNVQEADVIVDFSHPECILDHIHLAIQAKKHIVVGTTGWFQHIPSLSHQIQESALLYSPNFSRSVFHFHDLVAKAAELFPNHGAAALEIHHNKKVDAPSGTAKSLAATLHKEGFENIPISSVRVGTVPGTHTIIFDSPNDTITITHAAHNRTAWAEGAIDAAEWIQGKTGIFTFQDFLAAKEPAHAP